MVNPFLKYVEPEEPNPFLKYVQPEVEQNPFAQFVQPQEETAAPQKPTQPQETTSNPLIGLVGRTASLTGAFVDSVAEVAERVGDKLELAMPLSGIPAEDIKNKKQLQPLFDWAKSLKDYGEGLGYQPSTQLKELGSNPLNTIPFVAERVITSVPDMVSAVRVPVAYVMARTKEILDERVKNDEKTLDDATVADVTAAATAAVVESTLERFATKGLFKPTTAKTTTGRIAKETGIQAGTEVIEEEAAYLGEAAGTKKGLSAEEALTRGAEAAIVGGGLGFGVQGTKELFAPTTPPTTSEEQRQTILDSLASQETGEPAGLFADQEDGQPAGEQSQVDLYAKRAADALESTNAVVGRGSTVSSKYGDADQTLPPSDEPAGLFEDVDTGAATATTPNAPGTPAAPASAQTIEAYGDFVRQYTDLRDEYNSLPMGRIDQAGMNQRGLILKDLAQVVDANMNLIRSRGLAQQLKNPMFDGSKALTKLEPNVGQPRAMRGDLFGLYQAAARRMKNAMALSGQSVDGAIAELEDNRARIQEKVDSGGYTDAMIISMRPANMSSGQALKNRDSIIQNYLQTSNAEIDQAIDMLRRGVGQPRAMQSKLFGQPEGAPDVGTDKPEDIEDVFNAANADELNKSRMRASEKSKEIEAANKGRTQQAGASMTASERVGLFKSERKRVERELEKARVELDRLRAAAARPAGEIGYRPTSEDIREVSDTINGYERTLQGVREQLQEAEADLDSGIEAPTPRQRQEVQRVELTGEQETLFDTEAFDANATEVTERKVAPIVDERGAIVPSPKEGEDPIASAGFKTLDEDNNISDNLVGATFITGMDVSARNKGAGTRLLNAITNWADTNGKTLVLVPSANPDPELGGLSQKQLKAWYARNGFEDRVDYMVRVPTEERVQETEETKPAETVRQGVPPKERFEKAPKAEAEIDHAKRTSEGRMISSFFNAVESQNQETEEKKRHTESKNTARDELLEFDITAPSEFSSAGVGVALKYLADRVGGMDKLRGLIGELQSKDINLHSSVYAKYGLPDLSTRRGMDAFRDATLEHFSQAFGTEGGVRVRKPAGRAPATGEFKGVIPYQEEIKSLATTTRAFESTIEGQPREPEQVTREVVRNLSDNKLRAAAFILKQLRDSGKKISKPAQAAITYLSNTYRSTFGDALRDLAFDLAYFEADPDGHGAGSLFYKEGGRYAKDFREWVEANLQPETVALLDELIQEHKQTIASNKQYAEAKSRRQDRIEEIAEKKREAAEKNGAKLPKAPRKKKTAKERLSRMQEEAEVEAGEGEVTIEPFTEANLKNLPTVQQLANLMQEPHPSILRLLNNGDTRGALELLAQVKDNKYYAELAQRILDTGFTAKTRLIKPDTMESLSNDPLVKESLDERLRSLRDLVVALYPQEQQATIIDGLQSGKLRNLIFAVETMQDTLEQNGGTESNQMLLNSVAELVNKQFAWNGKYDPASDTVVMREGSGHLTNHLLLHETLHAAASHLIDNKDRLVGIQRQGYERLNELYEYSKNMFSQKGIDLSTVYGLQDIHEFLSEALTDPEFQAVLRSIRYKASPFSLYNRFTDAVRKLFNVKPGAPSNVMAEVMFAADAMMAGTMSLEGMQVTTGPKAMATKRPPPSKTVPKSMPNQPSTFKRWMTADTWTKNKAREIRSLNAKARTTYLGMLTLRQINDLVAGRIPQINNFIDVTEKFLSRKSQILKESGDISRKWERLQTANPDMSRQLGVVMHSATILEVDPDKATSAQRAKNPELMNNWRQLDPKAITIYRDVRDFYERRYSNYKRLMRNRINTMRGLGPSDYQLSKMLAHIEGVPENVLARIENYSPSVDTINTLLRSGFTKKVQNDLSFGGADAATILDIRNEFERAKIKGPYFPLMRFGQYWYQIGKGANREYYMFESQAAREAHLQARLDQEPNKIARDTLEKTIGSNIGNEYKTQMDLHARQSEFLKDSFAAIDSMDIAGLTLVEADKRKSELKDNLYQTYLTNQPDRSIRNAFIHRKSVAGYSEDALRSFSSSSYSMAYQMARLEYSPEMFSQIDAARSQIKGRFTPGAKYDETLTAENNELNSYVSEVEKRLGAILNPTDTGKWTSYFSNIGFVYYLTSIGSALVNVMGGAMIGVPTLIGQQVRANPSMSYTKATGRVLYNMSKTMAEIIGTGFGIESGGRVIDSRLLSPSLDRSKSLSALDRAAYNRFVADGIIDITAAYDQSGLASNPTSEYNSIPNRAMQIVAYAFHHAERFNREMMAMSAFRSAMEKRANYPNKQKAFAESVAEAKDLTQRAMFDYSSENKPRFLQNSLSRIIFQFKQFPQQMTWFLSRNAWNMFGNLPEVEKREARARFVGTMGMAAIFSGTTGLWGFSTVAYVIEACAAFNADDDEPPFDFELEFANWAVNTFGENMGTMVSRGIGNAAGVDLQSRLKLDGMWLREGRNNLDQEAQLEAFLVSLLGPTVGLLPTAARAIDLYNRGNGDRAVEALLPGFIKQPIVAARYASDGARTLQGNIMKQEFTPFELMMQGLGIRPADLAEIQFRNITVKGQEQEILKKRQNVLNIFGLTIMTNDEEGTQAAIEKIIKFNAKYPTLAIDVDTLFKSIEGKFEKAAQMDNGLYVDPKLRYLFTDTYIQKITEKNKEDPAEENPFLKYVQ
jgi:GNAT superfamily N-acetyltransferase